MAAADVQQPPAEAAPAVPDYLASPNAVFGDEGVQWRYGKAPDYSKTRKVWEEGKPFPPTSRAWSPHGPERFERNMIHLMRTTATSHACDHQVSQ